MKAVYVILFFVLAISSAIAQTADERALSEAVGKLNRAMIDANRTVLEQLTSDKLSYGHSNGLIEDKSAYIEAILDGTSKFTSIDVTDQTISINGDVAIVRHKFTAGTANKGQQPGTVRLSVLLVWQKQKGKWLLLARQATKI